MIDTERAAQTRRLPAIGKLLENRSVTEALSRLPRSVVLDALREELATARSKLNGITLSDDEIVERALFRADRANRPSLRRAINATGVVLHTGLGRAMLSQAAVDALLEVASGHSLVEIDAETGRRGSRQLHVAGLLAELTGAEAAHVVNNNAGATFLSVTSMAAGKEVILSRGELVEIGGSFRIPDIIGQSGATLVEVGTTNRTRLTDYEEAITERTGLILRCHPSNFKIVGFTEAVAASDLARLGQQHGIPVMDDLGSGAILDPAQFGVTATPTLRQAVRSGVDVVTASGDKLLGGPQAGIILGKKEFVSRIAKHPLARALRMDKLTLAALEATLRLYRDPERAVREIPTLRYLSRTREELWISANGLKSLIEQNQPGVWRIDLVDEQSQVGGGSLPGEDLPTVCVSLRPSDGRAVEQVAQALRLHEPAVFARIKGDALLLDPRTLEEVDLEVISKALGTVTIR
jgi:L-seryl-tRNA(Ser) seleniumtransferase